MAVESVSYNEPMVEEQLIFLTNKEGGHRKVFYKVFRILMFLSIIFPYAFAWYKATDGVTNAFSYVRFFVIAGNLLFVSLVSTYFTYRFYFRKLQKDLKYKTKTVEVCHITRKVHASSNKTYYFYLDSNVKMSIEVLLNDYHNFKEGDEICIEYATWSHEYFGYF